MECTGTGPGAGVSAVGTGAGTTAGAAMGALTRSICIWSPGKMARWILWDWHVFNMSWNLAICGC